MNRNIAAVLVGLAIVLGTGLKIYAENDQTYVIGFGLGLHLFSEEDDVRSQLGGPE